MKAPRFTKVPDVKRLFQGLPTGANPRRAKSDVAVVTLLRLAVSLVALGSVLSVRALTIATSYDSAANTFSQSDYTYSVGYQSSGPSAQASAMRFTASTFASDWLVTSVTASVDYYIRPNLSFWIVEDAGNKPGTSVLWQVTNPAQIQLAPASRTFPASCLLKGGTNYWLVYAPAELSGGDSIGDWYPPTGMATGTTAVAPNYTGLASPWTVINDNFLVAGYRIEGVVVLGPVTNFISPAVEIHFDSVAGNQYQLEYSANAGETNWVPLGEVVTGTGGVLSLFDSTRTVTGRLYRVVTVGP